MSPFNTKSAAAIAAMGMLPLAAAQNPGTNTPEVHPSLTTYKCTKADGCVAQDTSVVLDWNYRWMHTADGYDSCKTSNGVDKTLCPDEETCAENCVIEGVDYKSAGVETSGDTMTMYQYRENADGVLNGVSPRVYLLGSDGNYEMLQLLGKELTFTVDVSTLPCGENGALYLSEMDPTGGRDPVTNQGGAEYGSGYCDAQCPVQTWRNGTLNLEGKPYCCNEMDILENNAMAGAFTTHPCKDDQSACASGGCGFNPYAEGGKKYYGPGLTVDTNKDFTMVTRFVTDDGTTTGKLVSIEREYVQGGKTVASVNSGGDELTADKCSGSDSAQYGGLTTIGEALGPDAGMVLAFAIWNDASGYMNWLDSGNNGPCNAEEGNPALIKEQAPDTHVVFKNIRWGEIGSTVDGATSGGDDSGSDSGSNPGNDSGDDSGSDSGATAKHWEQCGGKNFNGPTACASPYSCKSVNEYYSQCL